MEPLQTIKGVDKYAEYLLRRKGHSNPEEGAKNIPISDPTVDASLEILRKHLESKGFRFGRYWTYYGIKILDMFSPRIPHYSNAPEDIPGYVYQSPLRDADIKKVLREPDTLALLRRLDILLTPSFMEVQFIVAPKTDYQKSQWAKVQGHKMFKRLV